MSSVSHPGSQSEDGADRGGGVLDFRRPEKAPFPDRELSGDEKPDPGSVFLQFQGRDGRILTYDSTKAPDTLRGRLIHGLAKLFVFIAALAILCLVLGIGGLMLGIVVIALPAILAALMLATIVYWLAIKEAVPDPDQ